MTLKMMDKAERLALEMAVRALPPELHGHPIMEIGAGFGGSGICLMRGLQKSGNVARLFSVDPAERGPKQVAAFGYDPRLSHLGHIEKAIAKHGDGRWTLLRNRSSELTGDWALAFLLVDGSHRYRDVITDLEFASRAVLPGGIVAMHDSNGYLRTNLGPTRALLEWFDEREWASIITVRTLHFLRRRRD